MAKDLCEQVEILLRNNANRESVLEQILHLLLEKFHSETGTIHRLDHENKTLFLISHVGLPPQILEVVKTIPVGKGIAGQVILQNKPVTICNLQTDTSGIAKPGAKQTGVGGALCVPLRDGDKTVGTIGIGTIRQNEFTPDETRELEEIGRLIGRFLKL
jgi:GAF domain-containing protein